jgi:hypothetical protein
MNRRTADMNEIKSSIAILFEASQVVEIRVPGNFGAISGYYDDHQRLAEDVKELSDRRQYDGIYYTLNPCHEALLARREKNRLHRDVKFTTSDGEVQRRRWLFIDFDPKRPKGVSATKEEKLAAKELMVNVEEKLRETGWPSPVVALSGNGYHLLYRVDEPNDAETTELFKKCLQAIAAKFTKHGVDVDTSVYNAARITKAYGSIAAKGIDTEERPHRFSKILQAPETVCIVTRPQLETLASTLASTKKSAGISKTVPLDRALKVGQFLEWARVEIKSIVETSDGGKKWTLAVCPFNPQHTNSPAVFLSADGTLGFKCFHASCGEKHWKEFRKALEEEKGQKFQFTTGHGGMPYELTPDGIIHHTHTRTGEKVDKLLTNFGARIVENVIEDDGVEPKLTLQIETERHGSTNRVYVGASEFAKMNWHIEKLGGEYSIAAGMGSKDHARAAIQCLSEKNISRRRVFTHTGWRFLRNEWVYLHGGGAIGGDGLDDSVGVKLPQTLAPFCLPEPPEGTQLQRAIQACLRLPDVAPGRITIPLCGAIWRSVLGDVDFAEQLSGPTGVFKSALAALGQQHFGEGFDATHLPASWISTANANAGLQFTAKDALLVVDDFVGQGSDADVARAHRDAERIFRGQGNQSGRARLTRDGTTLRDAKPPRCLTLSTGEAVPSGQSVQARIWITEVGPGDVNVDALTSCQQDAGEGLYGQAMSGFLKWLAPQYEERREQLRKRTAELRSNAARDGQHRRAPGMVANLYAGFALFLRFAEQVGAITNIERQTIRAQAWRTLLAETARAATDQAEQEPCRWFLDVIRAVVLSGAAVVGSATTGLLSEHDQKRGRPLIGWVSSCKEFLLLEPEAAYAAAQELVNKQKRILPFNPRTLWKRMDQTGYIARHEGGRNLARFAIGSGRRRVVCVRMAEVLGNDWEPSDDE